MKNLLIIAAIAVFGLSASAGNKVMLYHNKAADKYVVSVLNENAEYETLKLTDSFTGEVLLSESMEDKDFVQEEVDINTWGTKVYSVELGSQGKEYSDKLVFINGEHIQNIVNIKEGNPNNTKVFLSENNDELVVSHLNFDKKHMEMRIINNENFKDVTLENMGNKKSISTKVDISSFEKGQDYTLALTEGNTVYYYKFTK